MIALIKLDGAFVGACDPAPQGVGEIAWFHANAGGQSMAYYVEHGGYSVEMVEEIDCHAVEGMLSAICARAGVTMKAEFVPFSQSRNAKPATKGDKPWRSLNWRMTFSRHGREFLTTDYSQGEGHAPASKMTAAQKETAARNMGITVNRAVNDMIAYEIENGKIAQSHSWSSGVSGRESIPAPSIGYVMQSLGRDADVLDAGGFEQWAGDLGYDVDSRKAEAIYNACVDIAMKLRSALGEKLLAELRLVAQFN